MSAELILVSHSLAALLFAMLALWSARAQAAGWPRMPFAVGFGATALWALAIAGIGQNQAPGQIGEGVRNLAWLIALYCFHRGNERRRAPLALPLVYGVVAAVIVAECGLYLAADSGRAAFPAAQVVSIALLLRMIAGLASLVLLRAAHEAASTAGRGMLLALAGMWVADCVVFAYAYLGATWPDGLAVLRGVVAVASAGIFALSMYRQNGWVVQLSRTVAYQSLSLVAIGAYFVVIAVAISAIAAIGGDHARMWQTAFIFGCTTAMLTLVSSSWLRAWIKVKLAKHLFRHRYDYRAEWMRFTETLGKAGGDVALDARLVKALADLVDSPAGILLVPEGEGVRCEGAWNWDGADFSATGGGAALIDHLTQTRRIVELDSVRGGGDPLIPEAVPGPILASREAWAIIPLIHFDQLAGAILLARPPLERALDWEDFDLLKVAGRQAASYLAEARATAALMEAQRFDEFNRRFAFILHDIKNLVSQMSLVARNADRHGDNPEFRIDMIATVKESANRMNDLIQRLSQRPVRADPVSGVDVGTIAATVARGIESHHPVRVAGEQGLVARADPVALKQMLYHLVRNAADASAADDPVRIDLARSGQQVVIDIIDRGCGMSAAFIRDSLFKPFISTKPGGFGIGAYEARQLALAMGGSLDVTSREGEGTRFRIELAASSAEALVEQAA
ncbi:XrtA/PEP-CTERM system histidine kinase PrsK [Stakelama flava]|uniref:XrtA/PEP-CTERM system histidine kinase PrsK n=1 Tax=Stakelama flava TaxID=2860338 RepID=UPI0031BB47DB